MLLVRVDAAHKVRSRTDEHNRWKVQSVGTMLCVWVQFDVTYLPPLQQVLCTRPVPLMEGVLIVAIGAAFFALIEIEKQIRLVLKG